jgi:CyaY protein
MTEMTESQYLHAVESTLAQVISAIDDADLPAECALSGLVLNVEFDDGSRIVINAQAPTQQLWLASRAGGMHFAHDGRYWCDVRTGAEFFDALSRVISEQLGRDVSLCAT